MEEIILTSTTKEKLIIEISKSILLGIEELLDERETKKIFGKQYFTIKEAAELLNVSRTTIFEYLKKGYLVRKKIGKRTLIPRESILSSLKETEAKL